MSKIKLRVWIDLPSSGIDLEVTQEQLDRLQNAETQEEARLIELEILPETLTFNRADIEIGGYAWGD